MKDQLRVIPHFNSSMDTAVGLKHKKAGIFKKLIPQWYRGKIAFFKPFSKKRIIQYYLNEFRKGIRDIIANKKREMTTKQSMTRPSYNERPQISCASKSTRRT